MRQIEIQPGQLSSPNRAGICDLRFAICDLRLGKQHAAAVAIINNAAILSEAGLKRNAI